MKPLVLVGFMASGKSTVGMLLADRLAMPFIDTDVMIANGFGMPIAEVFEVNGEASFRSAERELILRLLTSEPRVIAAGGGAFIDPVTRATLAVRANTIWLDPPFETIKKRLEDCTDRPIAARSTDQQLRDLWSQRRVLYAEADLHITSRQDDAAATVDEIVEALGLR